jgi:hypothetical protein
VLIVLAALLIYLLYLRNRRQQNNIRPSYITQPQFTSHSPLFPQDQNSGIFTSHPFPTTFDQPTQPLVSQPPPGPYPYAPNVSSYAGQPVPIGSNFNDTPQMSSNDPSLDWNPVMLHLQGSVHSLPQPPPGAASPQVPPPSDAEWQASTPTTDAKKGRRTPKGSSFDNSSPPAYSLR